MSEENFHNFADILVEYLATQKIFVPNIQRMTEVNAATEIAYKLFPEAKINLKDDPLQMGAVILEIEDCFIIVREMRKFIEMINKANNFDIMTYEDSIKLSILFNNALIKI